MSGRRGAESDAGFVAAYAADDRVERRSDAEWDVRFVHNLMFGRWLRKTNVGESPAPAWGIILRVESVRRGVCTQPGSVLMQRPLGRTNA